MQTVFVWIGLGLVFLILTMIAFAHAVTHVFPSKGERVFWIVVALFPFLGWVLYFGVGVWRSKKAS
ncbi:hypothetical protein LJC24_03385 [Desulfococcaceae bacterium OttesenSCG-928-F15]|nr:hypothetical protein [Desulfococcaceae bacterium OttesenSCG-928-F15]